MHAKTAESISGGITETDPLWTASPSFGVTNTNISNWNSAYGWGNHAGLYHVASWVPSWNEVTNKPTFATVAASGSYNDLIDKPVTPSNVVPRIASKGQRLSVSFSGGDNISFSQSSSTCPDLYANVILQFTQGSTTIIYPTDKYYIDSKRFDAVFDIPSYVPAGLYDIILSPSTPCQYNMNASFKIY